MLLRVSIVGAVRLTSGSSWPSRTAISSSRVSILLARLRSVIFAVWAGADKRVVSGRSLRATSTTVTHVGQECVLKLGIP